MRHLVAALCLLSAPAFAQSNPGFITGQIPTAAQWNSYFGKKADVTGGTINNGVLNSVTINGSLGGSPTVGGVWTASNATLSGFAITGGTLGGSITGTGATITGGTFSGSNLGLGILTPSDGTASPSLATFAGDTVDARFYGVNPDWLAISSCSVTSGQVAVTCVGSSFVQTDVGKTVVFRAAGAAAASEQTTIAAVTDATHFNMALAASSTATNKLLYYGSDVSANFATAVAKATARGACLWLPAGAYGLVSQTTEIALNNVCIRGEGMPTDKRPYIGAGGTALLIFNASTPTFGCGFDTAIRGVSFFWPMQDGSAATPIAYPALIDDNNGALRCARHRMDDVTLINPYIIYQVNPTNAGVGIWQLTNVRAYCIFACFNFLGGNTSEIQISNWFNSPAVFATEAAVDTNLAQWTNANGSFMVVDIGAATVNFLTGMQASNVLSYGVSSAIHLKSGRISALQMANFSVDGSRRFLLTEGASTITSTTWIGGYAYCVDPNASAAALQPDCLELNSTGNAISLDIIGVTFQAAMGSFIHDVSGTSAGLIQVTASSMQSYGQSTTDAQYYGIFISNASAEVIANDNNISCPSARGAASYFGFRLGAMLSRTANGNHFLNCQNAILGSMSNNSVVAYKGNIARNTHGTTSFALTNGIDTGLQIEDDNNWDAPLCATIASGFGTTPAIVCRKNGLVSTITVGTTSSATGVVNFPWTQANAPACAANDNTTAVALKVATTTTQATITGAFVDGDSIVLRCDRG